MVITNPVDALTYEVQKISGLPEKYVIGTGTSLDSARLKCFLADLIGVDAGNVDAVCMGEQGHTSLRHAALRIWYQRFICWNSGGSDRRRRQRTG